MKTKIAALGLLLLASAGTAALAQERDGVQHDRAEGRAARERAVEARRQQQRASPSPRQDVAEPARPPSPPQARTPGEPRRPAQADGGERRRRPDPAGVGGSGRGRWLDLDGDEINEGLSPADLADREDRDELREGRRWQGGGEGRRPDAGGGGRRGDGDRGRGDGEHRWDGRGGDRRGDGDRDGHRGGGDRRGDNDHRWEGRGDGRGPPRNWPRWDGRRYPHSYSSRHRYRGHYWVPPVGFYTRIWAFGDILPSGWYTPNYRILDWWLYDLPIPPPGYDWVRVGDDALLVDNFSGRVVQVVRFVFW